MAVAEAQEVADLSMKRVVFFAKAQDLVHEWGGVWVVAEKLGPNLYRGFSHGKPLVYFSHNVKMRVGGGNGYGQDQVTRVRETSVDAEYRGEEVIGTLGELAESGCWYKHREGALAAARKWTFYG